MTELAQMLIAIAVGYSLNRWARTANVLLWNLLWLSGIFLACMPIGKWVAQNVHGPGSTLGEVICDGRYEYTSAIAFALLAGHLLDMVIAKLQTTRRKA